MGSLFDRLTLCHGTMISIPPPQFVEAAAAGGFRRVSLRIYIPPNPMSEKVKGDFPMLGDTAMRRETKARLIGTGVEVTEAEVVMITPDVDITSVRPYLESATYLGCKGAGCVLFGDQSEQQMTDNFAAFAELCAEYGQQPLVEFIPLSALKTLQDAARVVSGAGVTSAIVCDNLHFARGGGVPAELDLIDPALIYSAQLSDGLLTFPNVDDSWWNEMSHRRFLGDGEFPIHELVARLPKDAFVDIEVISEEFLDRDLAPAEMAKYAMGNFCRYFDLSTDVIDAN
jgi:sugar phosphate isomerase/epimerase